MTVYYTRLGRRDRASSAKSVIALLAIVSLILSFSHEPEFLTSAFVLACLTIVMTQLFDLPKCGYSERHVGLLLVVSIVGAFLYATTTYYFHPLRSWTSGALGLPFAFAVGLTQLLKGKPAQSSVIRVVTLTSLPLAVICVATAHYHSVQRDAQPSQLTASFSVPKLRHIRSTLERTQAIDALYAHLHPKIARGEPLLVFDDAPMLYYLFDAMPAYGLAWANQRYQRLAALEQLNHELRSGPLPLYAIRVLVDLSNTAWSDAPRVMYEHYPLNETVLEQYELEKTIFPFEIWRRKSELPSSIDTASQQ
jgi:hypothetical protein